MKIDTHQHYWHYQPEEFPWISADMPALQCDRMPADSAQPMRAAGVDAVVAVQARTCTAETDFLLGLARQNPHIVGVIGWADLAAHDLHDHVQRWSTEPAFKGLRHVLQDEVNVGAWVQSPAHNAGLRDLQRQAKVYEVLVFEHQMQDVQNFCRRHDRHWLVLDHVGKPRLRDTQRDPTLWRTQLQALAHMPHVLCKLSGLVTETDASQRQGSTWPDAQEPLLWDCFDAALEAFGPKRLMFGSDWPVCELAAPYAQVHGVVHAWAQSRLSASEQADFWHKNAECCYALTPSTNNVHQP